MLHVVDGRVIGSKDLYRDVGMFLVLAAVYRDASTFEYPNNRTTIT